MSLANPGRIRRHPTSTERLSKLIQEWEVHPEMGKRSEKISTEINHPILNLAISQNIYLWFIFWKLTKTS